MLIHINITYCVRFALRKFSFVAVPCKTQLRRSIPRQTEPLQIIKVGVQPSPCRTKRENVCNIVDKHNFFC